MGLSHSPNLEKLLFQNAKTAVQCIFAEQLTGSRIIPQTKKGYGEHCRQLADY